MNLHLLHTSAHTHMTHILRLHRNLVSGQYYKTLLPSHQVFLKIKEGVRFSLLFFFFKQQKRLKGKKMKIKKGLLLAAPTNLMEEWPKRLVNFGRRHSEHFFRFMTLKGSHYHHAHKTTTQNDHNPCWSLVKYLLLGNEMSYYTTHNLQTYWQTNWFVTGWVKRVTCGQGSPLTQSHLCHAHQDTNQFTSLTTNYKLRSCPLTSENATWRSDTETFHTEFSAP